MANLVWCLAILAIAGYVSANDIQGVLPLPEGNDIRTELLTPDSIPALDLIKSKPLDIAQNSKDLEPETLLQPIGPIFPSFFQPGQMFGMPQTFDSSDSEPKRGILTIILVKNRNGPELSESSSPIIGDDSSMRVLSGDSGQDLKESLVNSAEEKFKSLTQFLLSDLFGIQQGQKVDDNNADDAASLQRVHLLGGRSDPDHHFLGFGDHGQGDNNNNGDFVRFINGNEMPIMSDDIGRHNEENKCGFMRYLKLKAHIHYRTIVHLVFISGIVLMILLMISLTIKVHKRRNALRRYAQQSINHVSSIDSALAKQKEAESYNKQSGGSLFRSGTLTTSYEQKMIPGMLIISSAPPAYTQINEDTKVKKSSSSLIKSLAQAYKSRYQRMASDSDDDRKSVTSLPEYNEEKPEPKN